MSYKWESITVKQMGWLMRHYEDVKEQWDKFNYEVTGKDYELWPYKGDVSPWSNDSSPRVDNRARFTEVYFLAFVAAICEKKRTSLTLEKLKDEYHLGKVTEDKLEDRDKIFAQTGKKVTPELRPLEYYFSVVANEGILRKVYEQNSKINLNRIQTNYLQKDPDWAGIGPDTGLKALLEQIRKSNDKAFKTPKKDKPQEVEERTLEKSIETFEKLLQEHDAIFEEMKDIYMKRNDSEQESEKENRQLDEICKQLESGVKQIILTGAPGTGKTYLAGLAAERCGSPLDDKHYVRVVFHPSYDYTDFVEGLRPVEDKDKKDKAPTFVKLDGSFKNFCRNVVAANKKDIIEGHMDPEDVRKKRYFFLIDEINRADLSKVFGELMFCLEADKRVSVEPVEQKKDDSGKRKKDNLVDTQYQNLPTYELKKDGTLEELKREDDVFADGFYVPENVYIIGTMNDIDRSVESMDFALRRRFTWLEVKVDQDLLEGAFQSGNFGALLCDQAQEAAKRVMALNHVIYKNDKDSKEGEQSSNNGKKFDFGLNRQYYISQGQFSGLKGLDKDKKALDELLRYYIHQDKLMNLKELDKLLTFVWYNRIEPLLREYVRGEDEKKVKEFLDVCETAFLKQSNGNASKTEGH